MSDKPNIVYFHVDNLGYGELGCYGGGILRGADTRRQDVRGQVAAFQNGTPFQWTKQIASHFGGVRNGTIISWPNRIRDTGKVRSQFHHAIDVLPTILEVVGISEPAMVNGVAQKPIEDVSMA